MNIQTPADAALNFASNHYENFPVASFLLPGQLRKPIKAIYRFARTADDYADEGNYKPEQRLALLTLFQDKLDRLKNNKPINDPLFTALSESIYQFNLPLQPFYDLLSAFRQDVIKNRYSNFNELLDYCKRSANPIGYLILCLFDHIDEIAVLRSNAICTALQLINFLQDIDVDFNKNRIYLPQDELTARGITDENIRDKEYSEGWRDLIELQINRIESMLNFGYPLGRTLSGRLGIEIRLTIVCGMSILKRMRRQNRRHFLKSPKLRKIDILPLLIRAL